MNNDPLDTEYVILEKVYDSSESRLPLRQRDLAQLAGTSLGMTNSILKRLAHKGWITIKKLNSRNIQYAVTLEGMNEIIRRSYGYFKRTIGNVFFYKDRIDDAIFGAKRKNITAVLLVGVSDLDFIVEHSCHYHGLSFLKTVDENTARDLLGKNILTVYAETIPVTQIQPKKNVLFLSRMVIEKTAKPALV
ncbi:helix-turn-helix domain-containing protein [Treponema primitia]|uniref:helix-turn-helix domain-containing protein n=1 Tax=Treponema primitia TaxID=88058 RepID=UPI0002555610|nr:helix-turn-helix domain-containing protein [Treponema primitia]